VAVDLRLQERYRLVKQIGQGGCGKTFLAIDEAQFPASACVIKQFWLQNQESEVVEKAFLLFQQEAQRLEELGKHPQIPTLLGYFEQDQSFFLVQEFIDGINLKDAIFEGTFSEAQIWQLLEDLLPILKFIHDRLVIHQDIKPENIIRRIRDGQLVLVDFGAANLATEIDLLKAGTSIGSPEYIAPEQIRGNAVFASDLYSLGITCIYLLTGISPFDLFDVANDCWSWRPYLSSEVSDRLGKILDKLLQYTVSHRFQSADEVLSQLGSWQGRQKLITKTATIDPWQCRQTLIGHSGLFASVNSIAISPDGETLVSGSDDKTIRLWHLKTGQLINTFLGHSHFVKSVAFSPDGQWIASGSSDRTIKLWDTKTGDAIFTLAGHSQVVKSVAFSPDGQFLASGSADKTIHLWNLQTQEVISSLNRHQLQITSIAFSPDGQFLASASYDRTVCLWNWRLGSIISRFTGHAKPVLAVAFSPDSSLLATGSEDNTIQLWNLQNGKAIRTLTSHSWSVVALVFSPDGETLVSGSWDKTVKLWNVTTGTEIATLSGHVDSVSTVAISPVEPIIASGSRDSTIKLYTEVELMG